MKNLSASVLPFSELMSSFILYAVKGSSIKENFNLINLVFFTSFSNYAVQNNDSGEPSSREGSGYYFRTALVYSSFAHTTLNNIHIIYIHNQ